MSKKNTKPKKFSPYRKYWKENYWMASPSRNYVLERYKYVRNLKKY